MGRCKRTARKTVANKVKSKNQMSTTARARVNSRNRARRKKNKAWKTIRSIYKQQKITQLSIARRPFSRLVREVCNKQKADLRWKKDALEALQCASEAFLIQVFEDANLLAIHGKRITVMPRDIVLLKRLQPNRFRFMVYNGDDDDDEQTNVQIDDDDDDDQKKDQENDQNNNEKENKEDEDSDDDDDNDNDNDNDEEQDD